MAQAQSGLLAAGETKAVARAAGRMSVSLSPDGPVFARTYDPRFVDLLASDAEGQIFHRTLSTDGSQNVADWRRIGSGVHGAVAAVSAFRSELAVFGLANDGRILHRRRTVDGEWRRSEGDEWQVLGTTGRPTAAGTIIRAHWANETDLIVSAFVDDELAGALLWAGYPEPYGTTDSHLVDAGAGR